MMSIDRVWLDEVPQPSYAVVASEVGPVFSTAVEVAATSEQVVRWEGARVAWQAAQAEMRALYNEVIAAKDAAEDAAIAEQDAADAARAAANAVLAAAEEAAADEKDGPREWVLFGRTRWVGRFRDQQVTAGHTVHHIACPVVAQWVEDQGAAQRMRRPEAEAVLRKSTRYREAPTRACKKCAKALIPEPAPEAEVAPS